MFANFNYNINNFYLHLKIVRIVHFWRIKIFCVYIHLFKTFQYRRFVSIKIELKLEKRLWKWLCTVSKNVGRKNYLKSIRFFLRINTGTRRHRWFGWWRTWRKGRGSKQWGRQKRVTFPLRLPQIRSNHLCFFKLFFKFTYQTKFKNKTWKNRKIKLYKNHLILGKLHLKPLLIEKTVKLVK